MGDNNANNNKAPGWVLLTLGVVYPGGVIAFELSTRWCAEIFFDPMPSFWHGLMIAAVPLSNFLLWRQLRSGDFQYSGAVSFLAALAIGVAAVYTLVFLPLTPIAAVAIIYFGAGLLPLAPLISLVVAIMLWRRYRAACAGQGCRVLPPWQGVCAALLILVVLDIPQAATELGIRWAASQSLQQNRRGLQLLRLLGDEDLLLRRCYDRSGRAAGPLSLSTRLLFYRSDLVSSTQVREIFYRVTGEPFNYRPPPYSGGRWRWADEFQFDGDQGGTEIGARLRGLYLTTSRIDGSLNSDEGVAYLEWTLAFSNNARSQREVRLQLALPPQGVVSRATLWVNGEEREAAFAGRARVSNAYRSVVRTLRDPLLVTTRGTDRIQAQAFPLAPNGGTIKFRLGITAPLQLLGEDRAQLLLPAIVDRNFIIGDRLEHSIWLESRQPLQTNLPAAQLQNLQASVHRINATPNDSVLSYPRKVITVARSGGGAARWAQLHGGQPVVQKIVARTVEPAAALLIVLDGSARAGAAVGAITAAFEKIPAGVPVGLLIAAEQPLYIPVQAWQAAQRQRLTEALNGFDFAGGQDNAAALGRALRELEKYPGGELLWIHLPQPVAFSHSTAAFEQAAARLTRLPRTVLYSLAPGPNKLLASGNWSLQARTLGAVKGVERDLGTYFATALEAGRHYHYQRDSVADTADLVRGSDHIARLWARDRIHQLLLAGGDNRQRAIEIAAAHQLVTAVSGAVVMENARQYADNDLNPVDPNTVPTIPEPRQWLLALLVMAIMLWILKKQQPNTAAPAPLSPGT